LPGGATAGSTDQGDPFWWLEGGLNLFFQGSIEHRVY